jgi:hypothetical protein
MAGVETTTIRVRRSTRQRLQKEAELAGKSVTQLLEDAVQMVEEQRLLAGAVASWERHGDEMREEMAIWDATLADGLAEDDRSDALAEEDGDEQAGAK